MSEADRRIHKKFYDRCKLRLIRAGFDPKDEDFNERLQKCIGTEEWRRKLSLAEKEDPKPKRPSKTEVQLDILEKISDIETRRFLRRRRAKEELEDIANLRKLNEGLSEWGSGNPPAPSRERQIKEVSERLNEQLVEQTDRNICLRCKSSVCRCYQEVTNENE